MFYHRFYKESTGQWYIDLPKYIESGIGTKANLLMVAGADQFLEELAKGDDEVTLVFTDYLPVIKNEKWIHLSRSIEKSDLLAESLGEEYEYGATYKMVYNPEDVKTDTMWLCPVTSYVFGGVYPNSIYVRVVSKASTLFNMKEDAITSLIKDYGVFPITILSAIDDLINARTLHYDVKYETILTLFTQGCISGLNPNEVKSMYKNP
jgi:hypothetical protein